MARSYAVKTSDGQVNAMASWLNERIEKKLADAEPGLYRVNLNSAGGRVFIDIGARCKGSNLHDAVLKEAARLEKLNEKALRPASTGMPGIEGYQRMADASYQSQVSRRQRNTEMAEWLRGVLA